MIGIIRATNANPCVTQNNGTISCTAEAPLQAALNAEAEELSLDLERGSSDEFLLWLAGATGCGVLFAVICTLALWALEDATRRIRK